MTGNLTMRGVTREIVLAKAGGLAIGDELSLRLDVSLQEAVVSAAA